MNEDRTDLASRTGGRERCVRHQHDPLANVAPPEAAAQLLAALFVNEGGDAVVLTVHSLRSNGRELSRVNGLDEISAHVRESPQPAET